MTKDILLEDQLILLEVSHQKDDLHIDFKIWYVGVVTHPIQEIHFHDEAADNGWEGSADRTKCLPYLEGSLKWDGCINYSYPGQEHGMLHNCGYRDFEQLLEVFNQIYTQGRAIIPDNII